MHAINKEGDQRQRGEQNPNTVGEFGKSGKIPAGKILPGKILSQSLKRPEKY